MSRNVLGSKTNKQSINCIAQGLNECLRQGSEQRYLDLNSSYPHHRLYAGVNGKSFDSACHLPVTLPLDFILIPEISTL